MLTSHIRRRRAAIAATAVVALGAFAATAAALTASSGGPQLLMDNRGETAPAVTAAGPWVNLGGSDVTVSVPANQRRLINARFTAESTCYGSNAGYCTVRIIAIDGATGAVTELDPASGSDFHFDRDAPGVADPYENEAHAMERSRVLGPGTYRVRVQYGVTPAGGGTSFRLDDWHFAVETSQA